MRIVFFGTPEYVVPILSALHKEYREKDGTSPIVAVVTQRPKPVGRKQFLTYSPVDEWAHKRKIPIYFDPQELVHDHVEADFGVLASFAQIIPQSVIDLFPHGILNIHPSLLPKYRGSSPVQAALALGETTTGATIMKIDSQLDHGPIVSQFKEDILPDDTVESLRDRLFSKSAGVLIDLLAPYLKGKIHPQVQDEKEATFTCEIKKEDGFISPEIVSSALKGASSNKNLKVNFIKDCSLATSGHSLSRFIHALTPWPGAWTSVSLTKGQAPKRLKIIKAHVEGADQLVLDEVQLEGKNQVSWKQFSEGYPNNSLS